MENKWYAAAMAADKEGLAQVTIDGEIGSSWWDESGVNSHSFMTALNAMGDLQTISIDMNSPGGSVTDGLTIANYLRQHTARVVVNVLGQASSIASVIASAADEVNMGLGSFMMIHQPWTVVVGNADEMRAMAMDLDTINAGMLEAYVAKVGEENRDAVAELVKGTDGNGTILSAEMAVDLGLADTIHMEVRAAASVSGLCQAMARAAAEAQALLHPVDQAQQEDPHTMTAIAALSLAFDIPEDQVQAQAENLAIQILQLRTEAAEQAEGVGITLETLQASHPALLSSILEGADHAVAVSEAVGAEVERVTAIIQACNTTSDFSQLDKLVTEGWEASKATDLVLAAAAGAEQIHGSHSPEGGAVIKGIDSGLIYSKRSQTH